DAVGLVPRKTHPASDGGPTRLQHPIDRQAFEQRRDSTARFRPWNLDLPHAMFGTLTTRNVRRKYRLELARVQMTPTASKGIVAGATSAALGTNERLAPVAKVNDDVSIRLVQLNLRNA